MCLHFSISVLQPKKSTNVSETNVLTFFIFDIKKYIALQTGITSLNNEEWRGGSLKLQLAKESFLERLFHSI